MHAGHFALAAGIVYTLVGVLGFVPAALTPPAPADPALAVEAGYGRLLGLFPVNILHTLVHLGIGLWGLAAYAGWALPGRYARSLAIFYGVLAVMGLVPVLNTVFGLVPVFGHDIWLHAGTALVAAYFGFGPRARMAAVTDARYRRAA
jgi:hypothetical protein